jgi:hypothetical protein
MEMQFTLGAVLDILFRHTAAGASELADHYVYRDRTLIYKWGHGRAFPPRPLFPDIVRFAMDKSSEAIRQLIRGEIDQRIAVSGLSSGQKEELLREDAFQDYLLGVLCALAVLWKRDRGGAADEGVQTESPAADEKSSAADAAPSGDLRSPDRVIQISLSSAAVRNALMAAAACLVGDGLWAALAWALPSGDADNLPGVV